VRSKKRQEASGRHERPTVLQDPAKGLAAVVTVLNDQYIHAIKAAEVCVRESHSGTSFCITVRLRAYRMEERGWGPGRRC
jgi:hypothetical protein